MKVKVAQAYYELGPGASIYAYAKRAKVTRKFVIRVLVEMNVITKHNPSKGRRETTTTGTASTMGARTTTITGTVTMTGATTTATGIEMLMVAATTTMTAPNNIPSLLHRGREQQQDNQSTISTGTTLNPSDNHDDSDEVDGDDYDCAGAYNCDETEFNTATTFANSMPCVDVERNQGISSTLTTASPTLTIATQPTEQHRHNPPDLQPTVSENHRERPIRSNRYQLPMDEDINNTCESEFCMRIECPMSCSGLDGVPCCNKALQQFTFNCTTTEHPLIRVATLGIKGDGVLARNQIAAGTFIAEYVGKKLRRVNLDGNYVMKIGKVYFDAEGYNSYASKINHGCDPNCLVEKWEVGGIVRAKVVAIKDIEKDDELTFDYQWNRGIIPCKCGAINCRGYL
jgi:hypothetical protein